tara:strand:+ start:307 stop:1125 length:819 start_codon:yes stop_codon:yes gene_type:complete
MKNFFKFSLFLSVFFLFFSCSGNKTETKISENIAPPEELYELAMIQLNEKNYDQALGSFEFISLTYPLSNEAIQSKIMSAFIEYLKLNYNEAIFKFDRVINNYPSYKDIDYAYYMRAVCYFEQLKKENLDGTNNILAMDNFDQVINRFPNSKYAKDSLQKKILIQENIAAKHMDVANFYIKQKKYLGAMRRYQIVIKEYDKTKFTPEALHRLVEIYYTLGMIEDAEKTAAVLGYNYPESIWYKHSYELLVPKDDKNSLLSKISNFLSKEDEK